MVDVSSANLAAPNALAGWNGARPRVRYTGGMSGLAPEQIETFDRRRRRAPLLFVLFPLLTMPLFLLVLLPLGFTLEWLGMEPGPPFGIAVALATGWAVLSLLMKRVEYRSRCPSCGIQTIPADQCGACGQALTPAAYSAVQIGSRITKPHRADDDQVRIFRRQLLRARRGFNGSAATLLGGFAVVSLTFPDLSRTGWYYAVFAVAGFTMVFLSKVYSHVIACPHCQRDIAHRGTLFPFALPETCAACNQPLIPKDVSP